MARLSQYGLRRVLGTSALFSTAYGNVGSSIYYALGLVASYALGLTPVVFVITGVISLMYFVAFYKLYRDPADDPELSEEERRHIAGIRILPALAATSAI